TIIHRHGDLGTAVVASLEAVGWQYLLRDNRLPVYRAGSQGLRLNELDIYQRPPTGTLPCTVDALHPVKMTGSFIRYSFELLPLSKRASSSSRGLFTRSSASLCLFTPSYPAGGELRRPATRSDRRNSTTSEFMLATSDATLPTGLRPSWILSRRVVNESEWGGDSDLV
ncbi:uncharacterized protein SCHCODRAFT_02143269, partial [Schizophyllum commune H4-8]|uniref:uncharacterized protein n=1 Tax=Schizophyllum commune (strain H4-8 / FGSC 9210) TaxID=578458 RepID=UPI00215F02D0